MSRTTTTLLHDGRLDSTKKVNRAHILFERTNDPIAVHELRPHLRLGPGAMSTPAPIRTRSRCARRAATTLTTALSRPDRRRAHGDVDQLLGVTRQNNADRHHSTSSSSGSRRRRPSGRGRRGRRGGHRGRPGRRRGLGTLRLRGVAPAGVDDRERGLPGADGTARTASDYAPVSGTLTFAPGDTVEYVTVALTGTRRPSATRRCGSSSRMRSAREIADGDGHRHDPRRRRRDAADA